jgi:hypothetical protein
MSFALMIDPFGALVHGFTLSNAITHTQGFASHAPAPLMVFQMW